MSQVNPYQAQLADQLITEIGLDRLILLGHELERRKLAQLPQPEIHLPMKPEHWAAIVEYFRAPKQPEEDGAGGVDFRCQAVADAFRTGSPEAVLLAALRVVRKVWILQPHLGPIERSLPTPPPNVPPTYPPPPPIVDDGIEVP